ncbi:BAG family molecular chaperone regulator 1 isoform X1 [Pezoporus wallicus]|uniref:BAG family molecular chaperone regulator 1 isoform X1 n=1 Tax=Pezoporus wallicus TaxID=35540 RepID=UPI00254F8FB7|nr:BAG family molecular chaperone regulator 1 isoform X1 [Pezoporus wallicus]XP_061305020.1 BAG family molecular chaperone regulator 1 isoform X1 [Pezoporus flaviventris]
MAASGAAVTVTVTYSNEKHNIQVASQQENGEPTLQDMALLIEQVTGVPVPFQKLIYKGKSLRELEQPLSALGVKNGCKVMLIGKRNSPEEEAELKKLKDLEKSVEQIANKLDEVNKELTGIQKGFLAKDLQAEALKQLDKRIKGTAEQFMKILEQIDAILLCCSGHVYTPWICHPGKTSYCKVCATNGITCFLATLSPPAPVGWCEMNQTRCSGSCRA